MEKHPFADVFQRTFDDLYDVDGNIGELVNKLSVTVNIISASLSISAG